MAIALGLTAAVIMVLIEVSGPWWVSVVVGGFSASAQSTALTFIRVMALMMPAAVVLNCLAAADIARGHSRIAALRASVVNLFVTVGIVAYALTSSLGFLPWSFAASFNAIAVWSLWLLKREGAISFAEVSLRGVAAAWCEYMRRLRPLLAQPIVEQLHGWTERLVASGLVVGTMASLDYARTLTESAALIIAQPIGMAVLYKGALPDDREAVTTLSGAVLGVMLPASLYLGIFAPDIVALVFQRGAFDQTAVMLTSGSMRGIAAGLWAATLGLILLRLLNNAGRNGLGCSSAGSGFSLKRGHDAARWLPSWSRRLWVLSWLGLGGGDAGASAFDRCGASPLGAARPLMKMLMIGVCPLSVMAWLCLLLNHDGHERMTRLIGGGIIAAATASILLALLAQKPIRLLIKQISMKRASRDEGSLP